jgi:DNA polymerase III subunit beta
VKFRCERDLLAEAFLTASRATSGRSSTLPVLAGLRLELTGQRLSVTGTDLDLTIQLQLEVGGESDGVLVLPARLVADIVRSLGSGAIEIAVVGDDVVISGGRSQFTVRSFTADDYPRLAAPSANAITLPAAEFGDALRQVVRAASNDEARPILTGVLLTAEGDGLRLVATDSYRLAVRDLPGTSGLGPDQRVLVPAKALSELQRLLPTDGDLTLRLGERDATFDIAGTRVTTRLIEGEFPNYRQLIPPTQPNTLTVQREPLLEALRRVKIFARDTHPVRLQLSSASLALVGSQDEGKASEDIDARYEGEEMTVAFNAEYLTSGVEAATAEEITLELSNPVKPAILRAAGQSEFLYLLMPVRVPG